MHAPLHSWIVLHLCALLLISSAIPGCGDGSLTDSAGNGGYALANAEAAENNLQNETDTLKAARQHLQSCTTMSLVRYRDRTYKVELTQDEVAAVKALVQQKHLILHDDPGPGVAIVYRIRAGNTEWGLLHGGLVLDGSTRETSESRRFRYEHAELDFDTPGPQDMGEDRNWVDDHVRAALRQLVELHKRGKLD
jgi:hypothetical protein